MTNENPENQSAESTTEPTAEHAAAAGSASSGAAAAGLPLRGLAMVLIAVAVMLGLWALYAFTQGGEDSDLANSTSQSATIGQGSQEGAAPAPNDAQNSGTQPGGESAGAQPSAEAGAQASGENAAPQPAPADAPGAATAEAPKRVNVLNNSMVQGLAKDTSDMLKRDGYQLGEVGNFNAEILPETTVFFPAGDAAAEKEARAIADKIGGIARENIPALPEEATKERSLTVVLTQQN